MRRNTVAGAALLGLVSVTAGAFGAHALRGHVPAERIDTFRLAAHYQMIYAAALLAIGLAGDRLTGRAADIAVAALFAGVFVFSGSLYTLVLTDQGLWGAVTPIGGVLLHVGWFCLFLSAWRSGR